MTEQELDERLDELVKNTEISARNTSAYKRSLVCADDPRPSASYIGSVGVILLAVVVVFPFLADGINMYEHFQRSCKGSVNAAQ